MNDVLFVDAGNTRLKYRFNEQASVFVDVAEFEHFLLGNKVSQVLFACVSDQAEKISMACGRHQILCTQARVANNHMGLSLIYRNISKLGADRWLAMLGARAAFGGGNLVIVDAGTALKIDVVSAQNGHLGGSISPGLSMSMNALSKNTAQLPVVDHHFNGQIGIDTESCIRYGVVMSAVALIEKTLADLVGHYRLVLTGGDAHQLAKHLNIPYEVQPNLVLSGLMRLFETGYLAKKEST